MFRFFKGTRNNRCSVARWSAWEAIAAFGRGLLLTAAAVGVLKYTTSRHLTIQSDSHSKVIELDFVRVPKEFRTPEGSGVKDKRKGSGASWLRSRAPLRASHRIFWDSRAPKNML